MIPHTTTLKKEPLCSHGYPGCRKLDPHGACRRRYDRLMKAHNKLREELVQLRKEDS